MSSIPDPALNPQPASLPSLAGGTGSLAQSARLKQLNVARGIMYAVGILTIVINLGQMAMIDSLVNDAIDKQVAEVTRQGRVVDPIKVGEVKASAKCVTQLVAIGLIGIGILYLVFGAIIKKYPVPVTIAGLVIYVGTAVIFAILSPETLAQGLIIKAIVVVALVKALQAALAYQKAVPSQA
jgi:hypothetical protein